MFLKQPPWAVTGKKPKSHSTHRGRAPEGELGGQRQDGAIPNVLQRGRVADREGVSDCSDRGHSKSRQGPLPPSHPTAPGRSHSTKSKLPSWPSQPRGASRIPWPVCGDSDRACPRVHPGFPMDGAVGSPFVLLGCHTGRPHPIQHCLGTGWSVSQDGTCLVHALRKPRSFWFTSESRPALSLPSNPIHTTKERSHCRALGLGDRQR